MGTYLIKRLGLFIPTLVLVSIIIFVVMRIVPGDPALLILAGTEGEGEYTEQQLHELRVSLGTDQPIYTQYGKWIWGVVRGDFGESFWYRGVPVMDEIKKRFPITFELAVLSILISFILSVPIGVITAVKIDKWPDHLGKAFTISGVALPTFWVAILVVFVLARFFNWLPPLNYSNLWEDPVSNLQQLIFPALALGFNNTAFQARVTRSSMLEVLREDYIRTARAKGLGESLVLFRHALKNAFLPVITVSGWQFSRLLGGAVLVEIIFLVPGTGQLLVDSVAVRDFNVIQALIFLAAFMVLTINLIVDLMYGWLNPKVRYS